MSAYNLIIFDCDGTLVDSEILYNTITSEILTQSGYPEYTPEKCFADFAGHSWTTIRGMFQETHLSPKSTEERMRENGVHKVFDTLIHIRRALEEQKSLL